MVHLWHNYVTISNYLYGNLSLCRNMQKGVTTYPDRVFVSMRPAMRKDIQKVAKAYDISESAAARNLIKIGLVTSGYESSE